MPRAIDGDLREQVLVEKSIHLSDLASGWGLYGCRMPWPGSLPPLPRIRGGSGYFRHRRGGATAKGMRAATTFTKRIQPAVSKTAEHLQRILKTMDILGAAVKALEMLSGRGRVDHDRVAKYLDELASDAEKLAEIWAAIATAYAAGIEDPSSNATVVAKLTALKPHLLNHQAGFFYRLDMFYRFFTSAVGGRLPEDYANTTIFELGRLLRHRQIAKQAVDDALANAWAPVLLSDPTRHVPTDTIYQFVDAIQADAAALKTIARSYAASQS